MPVRFPVVLASAVAVLAFMGCGGSGDGSVGAAPGDDDSAEAERAGSDAGGNVVLVDPEGVYALHEWGVNVILPGGVGQVTASPYYETAPVERKPVVYIYGDRPFTLDLSVTFVDGSSLETWPIVAPGRAVKWPGIEVSQGDCAVTPVPADTPTDAELIGLPEWIIDEADCLTFNDVKSRLLFYNGTLPQYVSPLEFSYTVDETAATLVFTVRNTSERDLHDILLVYRNVTVKTDDSGVVSNRLYYQEFERLDALAPGELREVALEMHPIDMGQSADEPRYPDAWTALPDRFRDDSIGLGLTDKEARKLADVWKQEFFGHEVASGAGAGASALFPWDARTVEQHLPMTLDPEPRLKVRVMWEYIQLPAAR